MSTYFRIRLSQVPSQLEDEITTHCFSCKALGVSEALNYAQPDLTYEPTILHGRNQQLDVFFQERPGCEFFDKLIELDEKIQWHINEEDERDWLAEWKKGFKPFQLVGPYWIVPSWLETPAEAEVPISIDPGMAFGTGTHATTQMAAFFVNKYCEKNKDKLDHIDFLDVGTGTAVLAILAEKAGVKSIVGLEIDPEARRVARENIVINHSKCIIIEDTLLEDLKSSFDMVVANIIDGVLIHLRKDLIRVLKPNGDLFLTGILKEREDEFFKEFIETSPVQVHRRLEKDEWVGYWLKSKLESH
jgi:ribosomal protein L11 methyltransferase